MKTTLLAVALAAGIAVPASVADTVKPVDLVATHGTDTIAIGELHLFNRRALETAPNARAAGGFLSIYNYASEPNRLVSASSPVAERVELHTMTLENDVMRMRELEEGIELPGETQVDLAPGGLHVMFMGLNGPFIEGEEVPVTLTFATGESREIMLPVRTRSTDRDHGAHDHHDHSDHNH
ncbi:MAG: copper chaperone PCu(A)C [Pseudomonadota bacterium]